MSRTTNVEIFKDTERTVRENKTLLESVENTIKKQKLYPAGSAIILEKGNVQNTKIIVSGKRTLEAASSYKGKKVCIMNFASATNPGGGVERGSNAQEEALCRISTLYFCLNTPEMRKCFYMPHRKARNPLYNDDIIYSPGVCVIKNDSAKAEMLAEEDWYKVNVITCAAPNLRRLPSNEMNPDEDQIRRVCLPGSLRVLGEDAFYCLTLDELVIPEGVRYIRGFCPFMAMQIGTLVFPSTLEDFKFHMQFTNVGRYVMSEKNPWMVSVDDVIFSKDRKVLLSYPNARPADGYTVPKGTEEIAEHAFYAGPYYDGYLLYPVPLRALSLPLGLKKIGYEAFVGLDELISLTIPPTVESLSTHASGEMVSLQFLNMPDRLKNSFYAYWSKRRSTAKGFEGDNGENGERMENE